MLLPVQIVGIIYWRQLAQDLRQGLRPYFRRSAGAGRHTGKAYFFAAHLVTILFQVQNLRPLVLELEFVGDAVVFDAAGDFGLVEVFEQGLDKFS